MPFFKLKGMCPIDIVRSDTSIEVAFKLLEMLNGKADMKKIEKALMFK